MSGGFRVYEPKHAYFITSTVIHGIPEQIYSTPFLEQKLNYIHNNPIRSGIVTDPTHWKYSSAGFYYNGADSLVTLVPVEL